MRAQAHETAGRPRDDRGQALALRCRDLVERHFRSERRLAFHADALAATPARLNAVCKARFGATASGLLHDRIITEAKRRLIYTGMSAAEIGYALGFEDPAYFSRFFSKRAGVSPRPPARDAGGGGAGGPAARPSPARPLRLKPRGRGPQGASGAWREGPRRARGRPAPRTGERKTRGPARRGRRRSSRAAGEKARRRTGEGPHNTRVIGITGLFLNGFPKIIQAISTKVDEF